MRKFVKIFNTYVNPDQVYAVEGFGLECESNFRISCTGGIISGKFGMKDGKPRHTVSEIINALETREDLVD